MAQLEKLESILGKRILGTFRNKKGDTPLQ